MGVISVVYILLSLNVKQEFCGSITGRVVDIIKDDVRQKITIIVGYKKVLIYDNSHLDIRCGDNISVIGSIKDIDTVYVPSSFSYSDYLKKSLYVLVIDADSISINKRGFSINSFHFYIKEYLENNFSSLSLSFLKAFIIGDTSGFGDELNKSLIENQIIHLFAISGMHVNFIIMFLNRIFNTFKIKEEKKDILIIVIITFYLIITKFSISILRAALMYYLTVINKKKRLILSSLDICSISFLIIIVLNPFNMYKIGFKLSFIMTFLIIIVSPLIEKYNYILQTFIISSLSLIITFPIIINLNSEINLLSPIINVFSGFTVTTILLPLGFLTLFLKPLSYIYEMVLSSFSLINIKISEISRDLNLIVVFSYLPDKIIFIYYLIIFVFICFVIRKNKTIKTLYITFFFLFIIFINFFLTIKKSPEMYFLDLYNGEATVIFIEDKAIIIDTGDGSGNVLTSFLKYKGVRKIDLLFLTHEHNDHNGEADTLMNHFRVKKIIISEYDKSHFRNYPITTRVKAGDVINFFGTSFQILNPNQYSSDINDNSIVMYFEVEGISFLFTGDVTSNREKDINVREVDVLKIAHHGSITSSSYDFLARTSLKYAIIQTGRRSNFDFPDDEVVANLKKLNVKTYITKYNHTIILKIYKNKCIINTLK